MNGLKEVPLSSADHHIMNSEDEMHEQINVHLQIIENALDCFSCECRWLVDELTFSSLLAAQQFSAASLLKLGNTYGHGPINKGIGIVFDGLYVIGIKSGGSSLEGFGQKHTNAQMLGGIKHSGVTPGQEKYYTTNGPQIFGGIKNASPSPGQGNACTTKAPQTFGGIKNSGPSVGHTICSSTSHTMCSMTR